MVVASSSSASTRRTSARTRGGSAERFGLTFPLVYDGPGDTVGGYGVTGFPETFVIDREGRVVEAFAGAVNGGGGSRPSLRRPIERALES